MVRYLRAANVVDGRLDLSDVKEMNFSPNEQRVFALRPGDVLVSEGSGSLRSVGASAVWHGELGEVVCFQNTLLRLRPRQETDSGFLGWWCRHAFADGLFANIATGANIFHVSAERVRSLPVHWPGQAAQRAIAEFLDAETARIDALIAKKRRMIELAEERYERLVFAGITGERTSRTEARCASGLDWLGEIPVSWTTPPVGANFDVQLGKMLNAEAAAGEEQYQYIRNTNVQWDRVDMTDLAMMHFDTVERGRFSLREGDLLVCEGGEVGRSANWPGSTEAVYFQKAIHRVRARSEANSRFLLYCLRAAAWREVFKVEGNQATILHLTAEKLRVHRFPWPPPSEQQRIVRCLDEERAKTDALTERLTRQIALLREHRQALTTAVVTGEMEVPGMAA